MTFDLFMVWSNLFPSCGCNTGRMLHGICKYAIAFFFYQVSEWWPMGLLFVTLTILLYRYLIFVQYEMQL